jgi:hypothetical protein
MKMQFQYTDDRIQLRGRPSASSQTLGFSLCDKWQRMFISRMTYLEILCFLTVIFWQFNVVAGWNIQESMKKLLETLENSDEYDIVFPLVMIPDTNKLVRRVKRNVESNEVQTQRAAQFEGYGSDSPTFEGGNDVDAPTDNEDMMRNAKSATRSKTDGNKVRASSNNNHNTYMALENTNGKGGRGEITNRRVENVPNDQRKITYFDDKIKEESTDMGANGNKPDDITIISLKDWILEVKINPLLLIQEGLEAEWVTKGHRESVETHGGCKLQTGFVRGDIHSIVALTTCDTPPIDGSGTGDMTGLIQVNGDSYFIQPLVPTGELDRQHPHLVYKAKTSLELGNDQDFGDEWKRSGSDSSQVTTTGARNDSGEAGSVVADCLRSKRESYWRRNITEMKFSNMTGRENISSTVERPDVNLVEQPEENLEHTRAIIEHIREKLEREEDVGYFLDSDMEAAGKGDGTLTKLYSSGSQSVGRAPWDGGGRKRCETILFNENK